ncbi:MAG: hypothetical protein WKG07_03325 [Hymenobacter sp.]
MRTACLPACKPAIPTASGGEARFKAAQLGFYVQDEYTPVENLRLTLGMRIDIPVFCRQARQ